jgi:hypothetical protein
VTERGVFFDRDSLRKARYTGTREVVAVDPDVCPSCGGTDLHRFEQIEPALLRHGGYGAAKRTVTSSCPCGWLLEVERSEVHPLTEVGDAD